MSSKILNFLQECYYFKGLMGVVDFTKVRGLAKSEYPRTLWVLGLSNFTCPLTFASVKTSGRFFSNLYPLFRKPELNLHIITFQVPISQITSHLSSQQVGTLFLQLNVQDIGICIPFLSPADIWAANTQLPSSKLDVGDSRGAIVATVESSSVSACSAGSTVSTGKFTGKSIENVGKTKLHKIVGVTTLFLTQKIGEMTHNTIKKVYRIGFELIFFTAF